jgi:hypothetical protein
MWTDGNNFEDMGNLFKVNKIIDGFKVYQEKWSNYVHLMPECRLPRRVFKYGPPGKQDLGRQ